MINSIMEVLVMTVVMVLVCGYLADKVVAKIEHKIARAESNLVEKILEPTKKIDIQEMQSHNLMIEHNICQTIVKVTLDDLHSSHESQRVYNETKSCIVREFDRWSLDVYGRDVFFLAMNDHSQSIKRLHGAYHNQVVWLVNVNYKKYPVIRSSTGLLRDGIKLDDDFAMHRDGAILGVKFDAGKGLWTEIYRSEA